MEWCRGGKLKTDEWSELSYEDKNRQLYLEQKKLLEIFLRRGAISKEQFNKSLHDLTDKMGFGPTKDG